MALIDDAHRLARQGDIPGAVRLIEQGAGQGDTDAAFALANWRIFGLHGTRDLAAAHSLLGQASAAGSDEATALLATLTANGTGVPSDPPRARDLLESIAPRNQAARAQLALVDAMPGDAAASALERRSLSMDPEVFRVDAVLSPAECAYLVESARPHLQPSIVVDPRNGQRMRDPLRTSDGTSFGPTLETLAVNRINRRLAALTGTEAGMGEPLHMLRYAPGQQYRRHVDALPGVANQRQWTVLLYLNAGFEGGETEFSELGIRVRGNPGDAIVFRDMLPDGSADMRTSHAGLPVTRGEKWLATRWIRQRPYHPFEADH